jgi:hypothetical protein
MSYCPPCSRDWQRERYAKDPAKGRAVKYKWYWENPERVKETRRQQNLRLKIAAINAYGGKCACCGEREIAFLCLDHIFNDGVEDRKTVKGGNVFYQWLKNNHYPKGKLQAMCFNCNMAKAYFGSCPHQSQPSLSLQME